MAKISKQDIKQLSTEELRDRIKDDKVHYRKMKFNHAVSTLENPLVLRTMRRDIARFSTELRARPTEEVQSEEKQSEEKQSEEKQSEEKQSEEKKSEEKQSEKTEKNMKAEEKKETKTQDKKS